LSAIVPTPHRAGLFNSNSRHTTRDIFVRFSLLKHSKRAALYTAFGLIATHAGGQIHHSQDTGQKVLPKAHADLRRIKVYPV
jgi:hypothetical protein